MKGEGWSRGWRMQEMFNHSGDEKILEGRDTTRVSCLLNVCLIIPCHLLNAVCPTFNLSNSLIDKDHLIVSDVTVYENYGT